MKVTIIAFFVVLFCLAVCSCEKGQNSQKVGANVGKDTDNMNGFQREELQPESIELRSEQSGDTCTSQGHPRNCRDVLCRNPRALSGVYDIVLGACMKMTKVYCDMDTEGGGWTVFQRRMDGSVDFYRGWDDYEKGFGSLTDEFWLGNEYIHLLTEQSNQELRIDLADFENQKRMARYANFKVGSPGANYKLAVSGFSGSAGDSFSSHNGMMFSTKDRTNDKRTDGKKCAEMYKGAWWYHACHSSNLNGLYLKGHHTSPADGVNWHHWRGHNYSLRFTEMKIRPK